MKKQKFPPGWDEKRVKELIAHYENQTEDEESADIEATLEEGNVTLMAIPAELVPPVNHNSGSIRTTPAGGEVPREQYQTPVIVLSDQEIAQRKEVIDPIDTSRFARVERLRPGPSGVRHAHIDGDEPEDAARRRTRVHGAGDTDVARGVCRSGYAADYVALRAVCGSDHRCEIGPNAGLPATSWPSSNAPAPSPNNID